jgi:hypothetical protein
MLSVLWSGLGLWSRQQAETTARWNSTEATCQIADQARQAVRCRKGDRPGLPDALEVVLPADTDADGNYVPVWEQGKLIYREGPRLIFYLSDESGGYDAVGSILWRGVITDLEKPGVANVDPDEAWSLYYDTGRGRIDSIETMEVKVEGKKHWTEITCTGAGEHRDRIIRRETSGVAFWGNHEKVYED